VVVGRGRGRDMLKKLLRLILVLAMILAVVGWCNEYGHLFVEPQGLFSVIDLGVFLSPL